MTPANASATACDRATDDLLDEMVRVIVREIDPERIILFGSRARRRAAGFGRGFADRAGMRRCAAPAEV